MLRQKEDNLERLLASVNTSIEISTTHQVEMEAIKTRERNFLERIRSLNDIALDLQNQIYGRNTSVRDLTNNKLVRIGNKNNRNRRNTNRNRRISAANNLYQVGNRIKILNWTDSEERYSIVSAKRGGNMYFTFNITRQRN